MATTTALSAFSLLWALDAREVIARRITERREALKLTQQEVAERGRLPLRTYQRWESGASMPRLPGLKKVASALEMDVAELQPPEAAKPDDVDVRDQLAEVLSRLTRIEAALSSGERAADAAETELLRTREQRRADGTSRRAPRPGTSGR